VVVWQSAFAAAVVQPARVVGLEPSRVADLVVLDAGFDAGLRQGMQCRLVRGAADVAEVLIVDLRPAHSAALILSVVPDKSVRIGDSLIVKILKS
jgi:cytosine/adenosine deaminase-related metal-dependent hydrolase